MTGWPDRPPARGGSPTIFADGGPRPGPAAGGPTIDAVVYATEPGLSAAEFVDLLRRSTLAERRPVADAEVVAGMLAHADLIVTARAAGRLVGVARALTDFSYCTYLSDLAVDADCQKRGVGRELVRRTHDAAGRHTTLVLLAAPAARTYYPHIGMRPHDSCWVIDRVPRPPAGPTPDTPGGPGGPDE